MRGLTRWFRRAAVFAGALIAVAVVFAIIRVAQLEPAGAGAGKYAVTVAQASAATTLSTDEADNAGPESQAVARIEASWLAVTARATGIPARALAAYAAAKLQVRAEQPSCALGWNTLAAIGYIESDHGRHGGSELGDDGYSVPRILGPALDGTGVAAITDTDGGAWDGDSTWDRAVGPLQFIPDTWATWGADGDGDGVSDPNQIDDAALSAARYLCASSTMVSATEWRAAVYSYNHLDSYVDDVAHVANVYADRVSD